MAIKLMLTLASGRQMPDYSWSWTRLDRPRRARIRRSVKLSNNTSQLRHIFLRFGVIGRKRTLSVMNLLAAEKCSSSLGNKALRDGRSSNSAYPDFDIKEPNYSAVLQHPDGFRPAHAPESPVRACTTAPPLCNDRACRTERPNC